MNLYFTFIKNLYRIAPANKGKKLKAIKKYLIKVGNTRRERKRLNIINSLKGRYIFARNSFRKKIGKKSKTIRVSLNKSFLKKL